MCDKLGLAAANHYSLRATNSVYRIFVTVACHIDGTLLNVNQSLVPDVKNN